MSSTGIRRTLYLSERKDGDIIRFIEPLIQQYDFSSIIRELVRDGMKYRQGEARMVLQSNTPAPVLNIKLQKKEVTDEDITSRLDSF